MTATQPHAAVTTGLPSFARPLLDIVGLKVSFERGGRLLPAVRGIDLQVDQGATRVVLGESGSGKSVTLGAILGTHGAGARLTGSVFFDGVDLLAMGEKQLQALRGARIGFVPQTPQDVFDPLRRIGSQILECLRLHAVVRSRAEGRRRAEDLLRQVGIPDPVAAARSFPHELSGGMCQRAAIAMAISCDPVLVLADEPTTALDVSVQAQILELFARLRAEHDMALVMVTHDVGVAEELGGDVSVMYSGRVVEEGPVASVLGAPVHPYTMGLLRSRPTADIRRGALTPIPGQPPSLLDDFTGCSFAPRCESVQATCVLTAPVLQEVTPSHQVACPPSLHEVGSHGVA